jgi:hypothetical protein
MDVRGTRVTIDIFLADQAGYDQTVRSRLTDAGAIANRYHIDPEHVLLFLLPVKISFPRPIIQGSLYDRDVHAGQQYLPLLGLEV